MWTVICLLSLTACSMQPAVEPCPSPPEALTRPEAPLADNDLPAPLSLPEAYAAWMDDIRRFEDLRARHHGLSRWVINCPLKR